MKLLSSALKERMKNFSNHWSSLSYSLETFQDFLAFGVGLVWDFPTPKARKPFQRPKPESFEMFQSLFYLKQESWVKHKLLNCAFFISLSSIYEELHDKWVFHLKDSLLFLLPCDHNVQYSVALQICCSFRRNFAVIDHPCSLQTFQDFLAFGVGLVWNFPTPKLEVFSNTKS